MILAQAMLKRSFSENNKDEVTNYEIQTTGYMSGMYASVGGIGRWIL
jgi:hypothetical protein